MTATHKLVALFTMAVSCSALVLLGVLERTQADAVLDTQVTVSNSLPTLESVMTSNVAFGEEDYGGGEINTLVPSGTRDLFVTGIVEDVNGRDSIAGVTVVLYRSGVTGGENCDVNNGNDCYAASGCDLVDDGLTTDLQWHFSCLVPLAYFMDGTMDGGEFPDEHWVVSVRAEDDQGGVSEFFSVERELQTLLAVELPSDINYGELSAGESTDETSRVSQRIFQAGNDVADVEVSFQTISGAPFFGGVMDCVHTGGTGSIPSERQRWSIVNGGYESIGATALSERPTRAETAVPYRHGENPSSPLYWNISIPSSGVSGTCTGSVSISAVSH